MDSRARGIGKSVHSPGQTAFCGLLVAARRKAGLTQHDIIEFLGIARAIGADPVRIVRALLKRRP
jgi:hypothetical protein